MLKPGTPNLRIAFASNLHIGPTTSPRLLDNAFEALASLEPDVLILGGDYVFLDATPETASKLHSLVRRVPARAKFAVLGNHDLWTNHAVLQQALEQAGARVLVNDAQRLDEPHADVWVLGLDDPSTGGPKPAAMLEKTPNDCTRILVCHSPSGFELAREGVVLYLSGRAGTRLRSSALQSPGPAQTCISSGLGATQFPIRRRRPEVHLLECVPRES